METFLAFLSTLLGKAVATGAVAAASVAGLQAADVELPLPDLSEKPAEVTADDEVETSDAGQTGQDAAAAKAANAEDKRQDGEDEGQDGEDEVEVDDSADDDADVDAADPEANDFGQQVAADAPDGGVDGQTIAGQVRAGTPADDHAAQPGAPETVGERQDDAVRQDDGAGQDGEAPRGAATAEEHKPEDPGSQAAERGSDARS